MQSSHPVPLPQYKGWENGTFRLLCGVIHDFGRHGGLLLHFIQSKIVLWTKYMYLENCDPLPPPNPLPLQIKGN